MWVKNCTNQKEINELLVNTTALHNWLMGRSQIYWIRVMKIISIIILVLFCLSVTSCHYTKKLYKPEVYEERLSSIYLSEDNQYLVVFTDSYHYIFDAPVQLVEMFQSANRDRLYAKFYPFVLTSDNQKKGSIYIGLTKTKGRKADHGDLANSVGRASEKKGRKIEITGKRFLANDIIPELMPHKLNRKYRIKIEVENSAGDTMANILMTPVTLVQDTLYIGAIGLAAIPIMVLFYMASN